MIYHTLLILPFVVVAQASNDWSKPCTSGVCFWDIPATQGAASGTVKVWGPETAIGDITDAAGWEILGCDPAALSQDIRLVCTGDKDQCQHLYGGHGAVDTLVRLPAECGKGPFARVANAWVPEDQSLPDHIAARFVRRGEPAPEVKALALDTNFAAADSSKTGVVQIAIKGANVPGVQDILAADTATDGPQRRSRLNRRFGLGSFVKNAAKSITKAVAKPVAAATKAVAQPVAAAAKAVAKPVAAAAKAVAKPVVKVAEKAASTAKKTAAKVEDTAKKTVKKVESTAKKTAAKVEDTAKKGATAAKKTATKVEDTAKKAAAKVENTAKKTAAKVEDTAKKGAASIEKGAKKAAATVEKGVEKGVDAAKDGAKAVAKEATAVAGAVESGVAKGVDAAKDGAKAVAGAVEDGVEKGVDAVKDGAKAVAGAVENGVEKGVDAVKDGVKAVGNGAAAVGGAIADGVEKGVDAVKDGVEAVGDAAGDANTVDIDQSKALKPIDFSKSKNLFSKSLSCPPIEAKVSVDVNANAHAVVTIGVAATGTIVPPKIDDFQIVASMTADLTGDVTLVADLSGSLASPNLKLFEIGIPGLDFPGILSIGPTFEVNANAKATLDLNVDMTVGINYHVENAQLFFPPKDEKSGGAFSLGDTPLKLSADTKASAVGSVEAHVIPSLNLGISALSVVEASVFLNLDASAKMTLEVDAAADASATVSQGKRDEEEEDDVELLSPGGSEDEDFSDVWLATDSASVVEARSISSRQAAVATAAKASVGGSFVISAGLDVNAGATGTFFGLFDATTKVSLFQKTFNLLTKKFGASAGKRAVDAESSFASREMSPVRRHLTLESRALKCLAKSNPPAALADEKVAAKAL